MVIGRAWVQNGFAGVVVLTAVLLLAVGTLPVAPPVPTGSTPGARAATDRPVPTASGPTPAPVLKPGGEVRALWVVRTDITSPPAVRRVVWYARRNGFNTLFVQVRGRGDAYYASDLEPRGEALASQPASFDPLAELLPLAHQAGIAVHAWINTLYVWQDSRPPASLNHLYHAHPEWLAVHRTRGRMQAGRDPQVFVCPSHPAARAHLRRVVEDVARRYPVDGIQLDYIRYPDADYCFCAGCQERFAASLAGQVDESALAAARQGPGGLAAAFPAAWQGWRREQITSLVREIRATMKRARPAAVLSACVIGWGDWPGDFRCTTAYTRLAQDWFAWIRARLVDAVAPMTYHTDLASFRGWVHAVRQAHPDFPAWFGIGAYLCSPESAAQKAALARRAGAEGWSLFSYTAVTQGGRNDDYLRRMRARLKQRLKQGNEETGRRERSGRSATHTHSRVH